MKKLISLLCVLALTVSVMAGCGTAQTATETTEAPEASEASTVPETTQEPETTEAAAAAPSDVRVMALKGPTAMGLVEFMNRADSGELIDNNYQFAIAATPDEVVPKLAQGEIDMAAIPANLASVLYNNTKGAIEVLGINTLGVLYIVESGESVQSVEDLRGKTIYATGKGNTPESVLNYILSENGIDPAADLTIEWKSEAAECLSALMADENAIAMLPQPFVANAQMKSENIRVALDLTAEWDAIQKENEDPSTVVTGVVVARKEFIEQHPEAVSAFMDHYQESVAYVNENVEAAAQLIEQYDIVKAPVAQKALPLCNIVFIEGKEMQSKLSGYLNVLFEQNPKSVGGNLPAEDFYFVR